MKIKAKQYFRNELHIKVSKKKIIFTDKNKAKAFKKKLKKIIDEIDFFLKTDDKNY